MKVDEVKLGAIDAAGAQIEAVFSRRVPDYAVYRTKDRVLAHCADDPVREAKQRSILATLGPLRGEINGLIDGWRTGRSDADKAKAHGFERRVADALVLALEDDEASAKALLENVKLDIHEERVSRARFQYLLVASMALAFGLVVIFVMTSDWYRASVHAFEHKTDPLWLAAGAGAVGAFFSIATGIRNRTVLPDLRVVDNSADAVLRIVIGLIAATILIFLLQSGVVATPTFGNRTIDIEAAAPAVYSWAMVVVVAFTAGFLERLVPDLLANTAVATLRPATPTSAPVVPATKIVPAAPAGETAPEAPDEDADNCFDRHQADDETPDEDLPPARGGVATV
ncbi:hypothetical protein JKL49_14135 [Phenylobacterium sp. 20VBR1]|uniref:Uncharacterized protein n=1 Tax=Phenylobacterium glaciei TaxID=2803784 RepID=A0A941D2U2_9CAUL|nr:hypothetical protein [Phenylobacterium glaciei]MBR7620529.1 hypothetical protein [Phenylobacterium glaciei]